MSGDLFSLERHPLLDEAGRRMLLRLREHPDAPRCNYETGDRLRREDLPCLDAFRERIATGRGWREAVPPPGILARVAGWRETVPLYRRTLPASLDLERGWTSLPTTSRRDLALAPWEFVPDEASLDRLVVYRTAGTTGHPINVPHDPLAIRCYEPLLEEAMRRHGVAIDFAPDVVGAFLVGAQVRTFTYAAVLHSWRGAGFVKMNIRPSEWPGEESAHRYFADLSPRLLCGDPISFAEMFRRGIPARPAALVTTSVALSPGLKERLSRTYGAPVIDWYSMVETGPVGSVCTVDPNAYHVLPPDLFVEALRPDGSRCADGERGEIAVTGGRNPFVPLVRYRTGDHGSVDLSPCACGDPAPRLVGLEGREPLLFRSADGMPVANVDISRLLREYPLLLHEFAQRRDLACSLVVRPLPGESADAAAIETALRRLLGDVPLEVRVDPALGERGDGKSVAYRSELMLED